MRPTKKPDINDKDFIRKVMSVGFLGYISKGIGCILIKEPAKLSAPNVSDELLDYIPYNPDDPTFPKEAVRMMNYDPMNAVVLAIVNKAGKTLVLQLKSEHSHITPVEAYRAWSRTNGMGKFIPGEVLYLEQRIGELREGHYIYLGRQGVMMRICEAGIDEDDEVSTTDTEFKVHSDFEDNFTAVLGMIVEVRKK